MLVSLFRKCVPLIFLPCLAAIAAPLAASANEPLTILANGRRHWIPCAISPGTPRSWGLFETRSGAPRELH